MTFSWLLYILVSFNGSYNLEIKEYKTEEQCNKSAIRIKKEIKEMYNADADAICLYVIQGQYINN